MFLDGAFQDPMGFKIKSAYEEDENSDIRFVGPFQLVYFGAASQKDKSGPGK